jgi:hypothetical protein
MYVLVRNECVVRLRNADITNGVAGRLGWVMKLPSE